MCRTTFGEWSFRYALLEVFFFFKVRHPLTVISKPLASTSLRTGLIDRGDCAGALGERGPCLGVAVSRASRLEKGRVLELGVGWCFVCGTRFASGRWADPAKCSWTLLLRIDERVVQTRWKCSPIVKVASETASRLTCRSWRTLENSPHLP